MFKSIFRKHFLISSVLLGALIFIAFKISFEIDMAKRQQKMAARPSSFLPFIRSYKGDIVEYVKKVNQEGDQGPVLMDVIDSTGKSYIDSKTRWSKEELSQVDFPKRIHEALPVRLSGPHERPFGGPGGPPPEMEGDFKPDDMGPPDLRDERGRGDIGSDMRPGGSDDPNRPLRLGPPDDVRFIRETIIKVEDNKYVVIEDRRGGPPNFNTLISFLALAILLSSGISLYVLFSSFRKRAAIAEEVITQLQHGNLKARFPVTKIDEVGKIMLAFNKMADEIERVVLNLHDNEKARIRLLQELAHDLRTPVASLKNLTETLQSKSANMSEELKLELLDMSVREIEYFESLVEDLLFLGQVIEPKYQKNTADIDTYELLSRQLKVVSQKYPKIKVTKNFDESSKLPHLIGDEQLITRLLRNGLENAFSFAIENIAINIEVNGQIKIHILDDGPGLSQEDLDNFGQKRKSRMVKSNSGRVSVGLGSVIMVAITNIHQGQVSIQNRDSKGAHLTITLPLSTKTA